MEREAAREVDPGAAQENPKAGWRLHGEDSRAVDSPAGAGSRAGVLMRPSPTSSRISPERDLREPGHAFSSTARFDQQYGPVTWESLLGQARAGGLYPTDLVWTECWAGLAGSPRLVEGLFAAAPPLPPAAGRALRSPVFHKPMVENTAMNRLLIPIGVALGDRRGIFRGLFSLLFSWRPCGGRIVAIRDIRKTGSHGMAGTPRNCPPGASSVRSSVFFFVAFLMGTFLGKAAPFPLSLPRRCRPPIPAHAMTIAVLAEKPAVRPRDLARVLGACPPRRRLFARQRLRGHLGDRPPGRPAASGRHRGGVAGLAVEPAADAAAAAGRSRCCLEAATNTRWSAAHPPLGQGRQGGVRD